MGYLPNSVSYILYDNPLCKGAADYLGKGLNSLGIVKKTPNMAAKLSTSASTSVATLLDLTRAGRPFIRLAGISGAAAVALGAYGAHNVYQKDIPQDRKTAFETANRYHFLHTIALLAVPMCRRPTISGALMASGTIIFCGSCYHFALTGDPTMKHVTPYGGVLLIVAWLSFIL